MVRFSLRGNHRHQVNKVKKGEMGSQVVKIFSRSLGSLSIIFLEVLVDYVIG
jgi:hypothetical protein